MSRVARTAGPRIIRCCTPSSSRRAPDLRRFRRNCAGRVAAEGVSAVGQQREGGRREGLAANTAREGLGKGRSGADTPQVEQARSPTTQPIPKHADHRRLLTRGGHQVDMVRAERPVPHDADARHRVALFEGEPADELRLVDDEQEVTSSAPGARQPPGPQEGRRKRGRVHQAIPRSGPLAEVRDVEKGR